MSIRSIALPLCVTVSVLASGCAGPAMGAVSESPVTEPANVVQSVTVPSDRPLVKVAPAPLTATAPEPVVTKAPVIERPVIDQGTSVPGTGERGLDNVGQSPSPSRSVTPPPVTDTHKEDVPALDQVATEPPALVKVTESPEPEPMLGTHPAVIPPEHRTAGPAHTFDEADTACFATWDPEVPEDYPFWEECIDAALTTWCMVEGLPPTDPDYRPEIDDALNECVPPGE